MKTILRGPAALWFLLCSSVFAALPPAFTPQEIAQGYSDSVILARPRDASDVTSVGAAELREGMTVRQTFPRFGNLRVLRVPTGETALHAIKRLRATGRYAYVEPDRILHHFTTPNDPSFTQQWALNNTGASSGTAGADIGAVTAWNTATDASSVIVAVIDSGARLTHTDLAANLWTKSDGTHGISAINSNGITNTNPNDTEVGHGTHVSGIIGAVGNNGLGIAGVAWKTKLMELRYLHGTKGTGSTSDSITCINFAIANGAKIINASYGSSRASDAEFEAIKVARDAGVVFVAAAGNDATNSDNIADYPAGYALDNIVAVAATTRTDALASFSNHGAGTVDVAAPGQDIYSTYFGSDTDYKSESGTSMAAPHVSGAFALLRAQFPGDSYRQSINRLLRTANKVASLTGKVQTGARLNLAAAITSTDNRPFNDDFATRATVSGANIRIRSSNVGATPETAASEPAHAGFAASHSLWWSWTPPESTQVSFDTSGSGYDTVLAVYTGSALSGLTPVASNDNGTGVTTSRIVMNVTGGTTYQIAVDGKNGATGYTALKIGAAPANDHFAAAKTVTGGSVRESAFTLNATREPGEPDPTGLAAGHSAWYKWVAPASGRYSLAVFATTSNTIAAIYTGSSVSSLTTVAFNNDNSDSDNSDALAAFVATAGTTYYFQVDHTASLSGNDGGDFVLTLTDSLWEFPALDEITASPAVGSDGTIYFGAGSTDAYDTKVYAITANGTQKWSFATQTYLPDGTTPANGIIGASPAIAPDGTVYIGSDDHSLYALNGSTGAKKWSYAAGSSLYSTPALASDGTIYFRDDTKLYALTSTGTLKWSYTLNTSTAGGTYNSPIVASDGTLYVGTTGGSLYALADNATSAATKWSFTADGDIYTSLALAADGTLYFGTLKGSFYALTPGAASATQKWSFTLPAYNGTDNSITSSPALGADGTIYFAAYDHKLYAINPSTGATKWTYILGDEVRLSSPAVASDGTIYIGAYDGSVHAVSANGVLVRTYPTAKTVRSSPTIAGNRLYFGSADAKLHAFDLGQTNLASPWPMFHQNAAHVGRVASGAITIGTQSASKNVVLGTSLSLSVTASASATLTYQWYKNGVAVSGATASTYAVATTTAGDGATYSVVVSGTAGSITSSPIVVTIIPAGTLPSTFADISTRAYCGTGNNVTIGGFVVSGSTDKRVLVRAVGPTLTAQGLGAAEVLADPTIEVYSDGNIIATNDDSSKSAEITAAGSLVGATALLGTDTKSAELLLTLAPGVYSFVVNGKNSSSGIVLLEVYDTDAAGTAARFTNIASRVDCTTGNGVAIGGFVITGTLSKNVLIRAVGPTLITQGVGASEVLRDPTIELHDAIRATIIATNDNWTDDADAIRTTGASVGATPLDPSDTTSSAIVKRLQPGVYSFVINGKASTTGIVLVEVYDAD